MSRPEHSSAPQNFYNDTEARKYASSSRMLAVQRDIATRCLELISLPAGPQLLLDVGCGSGLSGEILADAGHTWLGLDISPAMLNVAAEQLRAESKKESEEEEMEEEGEEVLEDVEDDGSNEPEFDQQEKDLSEARGDGDLLLHDMGQGLNFRPNSFDGCVSVSAVQWLCNSYDKSQIPHRRLRNFFASLYSVLRRGARAAIQLYPETPEQMEMITSAAMGAGFTGGIVVDYPNSAKAKKFYLVLFAGGGNSGASQNLPRALGTEAPQNVRYESHRNQQGKVRKRDRKDQPATKSRDWILNKKDRQRKQGKDVRSDSKFTGRKRNTKF